MLADRQASDEESCPVCDDLLGQLYAASKLGLPALVATVPPEIRAMLALFCYRRSHLHTLGLAIAAACHEDDLVRTAGKLGAVMFARSKEPPQSEPIDPHRPPRRKITLSTGPLRTMPPIDDDLDEEAGESLVIIN
jgi:hypothetical protein